ncbi:Two-component sensor histidine kinase [Castellaniella defragrans 65Phen]|uniref:histidine kinase n=1 Tax=Castellaniella defragrans (strain DSM 12143 / CCUG 39792 / 65Phen) TaxID=1437824 RepID=W8X9P0_CASD6|nr:ATP-binding protein [Castellaniella defragrans]CDM25160.1 Two-component sensor histidine kinase [Castellaniella defragrans 65Phen]
MLTRSHSRGKPWSDTWARLEDESIMLQRIAAGQSLADVLAYMLSTVEAQSSVPLWTSIHLLDEAGWLRLGAAPRLPAECRAALDSVPVGPHAAGWGLAACSGEPVYVEDIAAHPDWAAWRDPLLAFGLRACWASPIRHVGGRLLGVFSNYYRQPRLPTEHDVEAIALVARTAALAIERQRTEQALREGARRWRSMFEGMREGFFMAEAVRDEAGACRELRLLEANPAFELQCGLPPGTCVGRTLREVLRRAPAGLLDRFTEVLASGEHAQIEYCVEGPIPAWYEVHLRREGTDRVMAMQLDVSARKRAEKNLLEEQRRKNFQLTLGDRLRHIELPARIESTVCEALGRHFELSEVCLLSPEPHEDGIRVLASWSPSGVPAPLSRAVRLALRKAILRERSVFLSRVADVEENGLVVPLGRWGRPGQGLVLRSAQTFRPQLADLTCIEEVAERLCDATERAAHPLQLQERVEQTIAERDRIWRLSPEILAIMDEAGCFLNVSPAVRAILGWTPEQFLARGFLTLLHPDDRRMTRLFLAQAAQSGSSGLRPLENRLRRRDGGYSCITWTASFAQGLLYLAGRDDTQAKAQAEALSEAETALRQAQKLEAVGRLTGGIAHDFNNILQGISGALYLVERHLRRGDVAAIPRYVGMATDACERAGQLTQRLLAFSRPQPVNPRVCDVAGALRSMLELFRRYTGERVVLDMEFDEGLWPVRCDVSQFENVVLNLVINACDAMPEGGGITLRVRNVRLDGLRLRRFPRLLSGEFVEVAVADTGGGMTPEVLARTFEPFFTTKPVGAGTGLGLSTCYRFAQQAGGAVDIESTVGEGTVVRIWLPRHSEDRSGEPAPAAAPAAVSEPAADERQVPPQAVVLLVEDNESVREMMTEAIAGLGATVLCAADGVEGVRVLERAGRVDLLITDVGLPGMDGRALAERAREGRPGLPVLFMTGHLEAASKDAAGAAPGMELIVKPFTLDVLAARVRAMLLAGADGAGREPPAP